MAFDVPLLSITLFSIVVFCLYKYLTSNFDYWKVRGVIYKEPSILFGNLKEFVLTHSTSGKVYKKIYNEYPNEKYVGCFKLKNPELMVRDPELIKCVLVKDFNVFRERNTDVSDKIEKLNGHLFAVQGARWKGIRKKMSPLFTSGKLKVMFHLVVEKAEEFQKLLETEVKKNEIQEVRELMSKFTTDVIGSCAFGVNLNSMLDSEAPFRKMGRKIFEANLTKLSKVVLRLISPEIFNFFNLRVLEKGVEDFFIKTVTEIVKQRQETGIKRNDFIDMMIELKSQKQITGEGEVTVEVDDIFMTAQAFIFFAAGFETSSAVMAFTLFELAKNPKIQEQLIEEIDSVTKKYDGKFSYDAISEMTYLECVICETMRKYPALGILTRQCISKYEFPDTNLTIDEKVSICIPVYAIHYDPKYYPEPDKFIPERFSPEAKQERHPMVYLPFGEGPRNCVGLRFGKMQSMIGLAALLRKFTVHECSKTEDKIKMNPMSFVTSCKNGVWLKLQLRNSTN